MAGNPLDKFKGTDTDVLKKLLEQKKIFGSATDDVTRQTASAEGNRLRESAGIKASDSGLLNTKQLEDLIASRSVPTVKTGVVKPLETKLGVAQAPTLPRTPQGPTPEQLRNTILQSQERQKLADLSRSSDKATQAVKLRAEGIAPRIKGFKSAASVGSQLGQKRLKDLFASTGAAAGTGAARAISEEQGLQSQLGALDVQEAQELADVSRDLADIQSEKAFVERQIKAGTATAQTQAKLEALQAEQAQAAREAEINSEREFKIFETNLNNFNEREMIGLKNDLEQNNTVLDAEIQRNRDQILFTQDVTLKAQLAQDNERLQGIKNSNALKLASINNAADIAQQQLRGSQQLDQIGAKGAQDRITAGFKDELSGVTSPGEQGLPLKTIETAVKNTIDRGIQAAFNNMSDDDRFNLESSGRQALSIEEQNNVVMDTILSNLNWFGPLDETDIEGINKLNSVLSDYGITGAMLDERDAITNQLPQLP